MLSNICKPPIRTDSVCLDNLYLFMGAFFAKGLFSSMNKISLKPRIFEVKENLVKHSGGSVLLTKEDQSGVAIVSFSNPKKKNSWTGAMMVQLADIITELEKWTSGKSLLFCSEGNYFCSGADLSIFSGSSNFENARNMSYLMHDNMTRLSCLPLVSAVLAQGKAIGGGAELLTACDYLLITPDFQCSFVHLKMGLITGWGGTTRMVQLIGASKFLKVMTTSQNITADEALSLGLATSILNLGDPKEQAINWLKELSQADSNVLRTLKQAVIYASTLSTKESLEKELELFNSLVGGPANLKALESRIKHR